MPPAPARPLAEALAELRAGMAEIAAALEPGSRATDLTAGRRLGTAHLWLDEAELAAGREDSRRSGAAS